MRGHDEQTTHMFSYLSPEQRVPADHPLRAVRALTDEALQTMSRRFASLYATTGCQGRSKIRPRWRRKTRPAGHWTECLKAAVRGKASGPRGGRVLAGVLAVCEAIAVAVQLQDVDVMGESVEECTG